MIKESTKTPSEWEDDVKLKLNEFIANMLSISKECNMATKYFNPVKDIYETHTEYDKTKTNGAELRIVFSFVDDLNIKDMDFI